MGGWVGGQLIGSRRQVCGCGGSGESQGHQSGGPACGLHGPALPAPHGDPRDPLCRDFISTFFLLCPRPPLDTQTTRAPSGKGPAASCPLGERALMSLCQDSCGRGSRCPGTFPPRGVATALPVGRAAVLKSTQPRCWEGMHENPAGNLSPPLGKQAGASLDTRGTHRLSISAQERRCACSGVGSGRRAQVPSARRSGDADCAPRPCALASTCSHAAAPPADHRGIPPFPPHIPPWPPGAVLLDRPWSLSHTRLPHPHLCSWPRERWAELALSGLRSTLP